MLGSFLERFDLFVAVIAGRLCLQSGLLCGSGRGREKKKAKEEKKDWKRYSPKHKRPPFWVISSLRKMTFSANYSSYCVKYTFVIASQRRSNLTVNEGIASSALPPRNDTRRTRPDPLARKTVFIPHEEWARRNYPLARFAPNSILAKERVKSRKNYFGATIRMTAVQTKRMMRKMTACLIDPESIEPPFIGSRCSLLFSRISYGEIFRNQI